MKQGFGLQQLNKEKENRDMKKIFLALALLVSMACQAQKQLEILHTNDTHSCIMPLNVNLADTSVAGRGGFVRRVAMIKQERERNPQLLPLIVATSRKDRLTTRCLKVR